MAYPPMRFVETIQIEHNGQPMMLIRDPEGLCTEPLAVPLPIFLIMTQLDGERDARDLQTFLTQATGGQIIPTDEIERIVTELDQYYLLDNERATVRRGNLEAEFAALPARPAAHAGTAYPAEAEACLEAFDQLFAGLDLAQGRERPRGLVLPHIDLRVGGKCLAKGYTRLDPARPPRLYIILGVAHHHTRNLFTLTDKSFETPLGLAETDQNAVARLRALYGAERLEGDLIHKQEHSIEFQAVALRYFHRDEPDFKILPILCGSLHEDLRSETTTPMERPDMKDFVAALQQLIKEYNGDVCVMASVDLSHVGLKFGDDQGVDEMRALTVLSADERMMGEIEKMDAEAFLKHFRDDGNSRNVDAVTAVYLMMKVLGPGHADKIDYQQWYESETDSMVTFASLAVY